ncbi:MAG: metal ABC transporter solute-binding protein, Zn/Mn family [Thermoguttaceae bacterium]
MVVGCVASRTEAVDGRLAVAVSIEPLAFLVREVGGDDVDVEVIVPAGRDPESFHPTPRTVSRLERSLIVFRLGFPFETTLLPKLPRAATRHVVDLREGQTLHTAAVHSHAEHEHDSGGAMCVSDDGSDNHIWLSPTCLLKMVEAIVRELSLLRPESADDFASRGASLAEQIKLCRDEIAAKLEPRRGETILVFHPAYRYFCDEFGLFQRAIEFEGRSPRPQEIAAWIDAATEKTASPVIIVQPEFSRSSAKAISEAIRTPLAEHSPLQYNVIESLRKLTDVITAPR